MGQFHEISQYNVHLNVFERLWAAWYAYMQNDVLATGIMSFVMHEFVYFGRSLPWIIIGRIPYFQKYKIQGVCVHLLFSVALQILTLTCSIRQRFQPLPSNGIVPNWSSSLISLSSFLKSGFSIPWQSTSAWALACHFHQF